MENIQDLKNEISEKNGKNTGYNDPITGRFIKDNPGKPLGALNKRFTDEIDDLLDEMAEGKNYTYRKALKKQVLKRMIIDGDTGLIKEYWQQKDGKPLQRIDQAVSGELKIKENSQDLDLLAKEVSKRLKEKKLNDTQSRTA